MQRGAEQGRELAVWSQEVSRLQAGLPGMGRGSSKHELCDLGQWAGHLTFLGLGYLSFKTGIVLLDLRT